MGAFSFYSLNTCVWVFFSPSPEHPQAAGWKTGFRRESFPQDYYYYYYYYYYSYRTPSPFNVQLALIDNILTLTKYSNLHALTYCSHNACVWLFFSPSPEHPQAARWKTAFPRGSFSQDRCCCYYICRTPSSF